MTRIFWETIAQAVLVAIFAEPIFRWIGRRINASLDAPKKPCQSVSEFDEMEGKQW